MGSRYFDVLHPFAGPCLICGGPDKRHRLADSIVDYARGGMTPKAVGDSFRLPEETVLALVEIADRNRTRHKARWS